MMPPEKHMPLMQKIETAVSDFYATHRGINNYTVMRVYDAAIDHYRAAAQGKTAQAKLSEVEAELYKPVLTACEAGFIGGFLFDGKMAQALSPEEILSALRKLRKSVDFWHNQGGRTGYLDFIQEHV